MTDTASAALLKRKSPPNLMGLYAATVAIVRRRGPGFTALDAEVEIGKAFDKFTAQWLASLPAPVETAHAFDPEAMAHIAGEAAGLKASQVPGLAHLFRLAYNEGRLASLPAPPAPEKPPE